MLVYIQILRFAAAVAVAAFHAWGIVPRFIAVPADTPTLGLWQAPASICFRHLGFHHLLRHRRRRARGRR